MSDSMIERVARALHAEIAGSDPDERIHAPYQNWWETPTKRRWEQWEDAARAAIEAMRPATDAMKVAGGLKCEAIMFEGEGSGVIFNDMGEVFTTMIDAALSEGKP